MRNLLLTVGVAVLVMTSATSVDKETVPGIEILAQEKTTQPPESRESSPASRNPLTTPAKPAYPRAPIPDKDTLPGQPKIVPQYQRLFA